LLCFFLRNSMEMRNYALLIFTSAVCDCVGLMALTASMPRSVILEGSCVMEFHGFCSTIGVRSCWFCHAVQEYIFIITSLLLCFSFAYRLQALK
ncbi:hypothetical protein PFISCL1PPCAC_2869, partial [Pristionchus fissidentatus]